MLIQPFDYHLPNDMSQYSPMLVQLKRIGRIAEHAPGNIASALRARAYLADTRETTSGDMSSVYTTTQRQKICLQDFLPLLICIIAVILV